LIVLAVALPRAAHAEDQVSAVMVAARTYWVRLVCETNLVSRMDAAFKRRQDVLSQGAAGKLSPERWRAERKALSDDFSSIWRAESLPSKDYLKSKLMAAALLHVGGASEASFAEDVQRQAAGTCPLKAADHDAVVAAAMGLVPMIANDPGQQPPHTDEKPAAQPARAPKK
jgi:hypothetical protein